MTGTPTRRSRRLAQTVDNTKNDTPSSTVVRTTTNGNLSNGGKHIQSSDDNIDNNVNKRRKLESPEDRISSLITNHNMLVNELFNLREYKNVLYWDPSLYSSTKSLQLPEIFEEFTANPAYQVSWSETPEADQKELDSIPLRLQKRVLIDREKKLLEKYPFKESAIQKSVELEDKLLNDIDVVYVANAKLEEQKRIKAEAEAKKKRELEEKLRLEELRRAEEREKAEAEAALRAQEEEEVIEEVKPVKSAKGSTSRTNSKITKAKAVPQLKSRTSRKKLTHVKKEAVAEEEEEVPVQDNPSVKEESEESEESSDEDVGTNYKLKSTSYTMPPPLVMHPSHIPLWRPTPSHDDGKQMRQYNNTDDSDEPEKYSIIPFNAEKIKVIINKDGSKTTYPSLQDKIHNYLENKYKSAIIDESVMPDYNNSIEEYNQIMEQQEDLVKKLYQKIYVERRLELHGDKVEQRKTVLPQTNSKLNIDPFRANDLIITAKSVHGSTPNSTHQDILLRQGMAFSKVHQNARKQHLLKTRRIAQMIEQYFRKKAGEKERLEREREQNLRRISRLAVQAVKRRWIQASKVYRHLQQQEEEELKRIKGREHLSQMLEHSTQLLEAQLAKPPIQENPEDSSSESESSQDSDHHLSSSSDDLSDEEEEEVRNELGQNDIETDANDEKLTLDELRLKYKEIKASTSPPSSKTNSSSSESEEVEEEEDDDIDISQGLSALYGGKVSTPDVVTNGEYSNKEIELIDSIAKEEKNSVLDAESDNDSISTESDSDSDDESGSESDNEKVPHAKAEKVGGLSSLFSNGDIEDDSSDEEISQDQESEDDSDDDNMSETTDEEEEPTTPKSTEDTIGDDKGVEEILEEEINGSKVRDVPVPPLLRGTLRPYQKQGLNWMASLYNNNTNGILADEMGLGKTIQTISLLAYLASEHHIWGPHLIVVPTSVMLNWEMEFKKFAPGFKVLTYYGSPQQRAAKRKGWNKPDAFHVCITSYQLVVHDHQSFKRRRWRYMILDEAHNIKNFRSTRWRALLNFNTENRLLLTGTPLQNNLMELWSLLYFLMPSSKVNQAMPDGFANLEDFQTWFGKPVDRILEQTTMGNGNQNDLIDENATSKMDSETRNTVSRLHQVLRPYLLRRLKKDVEKQMPGKYEHIVYCRLSKRQRYLYDDFMSRAKTKETLSSGNFLSIINCLMQLRKVCNHPDLFEVRPIVTSFVMPQGIANSLEGDKDFIQKIFKAEENFREEVSLNVLNLDITNCEDLNIFTANSSKLYKSIKGFEEQIKQLDDLIEKASKYQTPQLTDHLEYYKFIKLRQQLEGRARLEHAIYLNNLRCERTPMYGKSLLLEIRKIGTGNVETDAYRDLILPLNRRKEEMTDYIEKFSVLTPAVVALDMKDQLIPVSTQYKISEEVSLDKITNPFHQSQVKLSIAFPDKSLLQYDCGKLQKLATLLQDLKAGGHRALIFTQMTKVLDILEQFLNIHGYRYMRLDGSTKIEDRQLLTEKFNRDNKIPVFILSTRSGGLGINLTGADTVIFYDSDWNPAMDKQCQDRCHRIGQTRDVHIYRFVSEYTIESNILKKANQKRQLDNVVIQEGEFTTDYFGKFSVKDLVSGEGNSNDDIPDRPIMGDGIGQGNVGNVLAQAEDEEDRNAANAAMKEIQVDDEDFDEESKPATAGTTPVPSAGTPGMDTKSTTPVVTTEVNTDLADIDFEEGVGHVDEYMLRFIADGNFWD